MPRRKRLSIEDRNDLERQAIDLAKQRGLKGPQLTSYVEGWMNATLLYLEPKAREKK